MISLRPPLRAVAVAIAALPFGVACGGNAASNIAKAPEFNPENQSKCAVRASQSEPLIVEWPPAERGRLEASLRHGLVAVRYVGCEMKLVPECRVRSGEYKYAPVTRKADSVHIKNEDDLYASLPAGAARFEAKLKSAGQLHVQMTMVGRYESSRSSVGRGDLSGDCDEVTHVVSALTVGAFTFYAGADAQVGAGATALGVGASGSSAAHRETLTQDGDDAACARATGNDERPPDGCGALIRLEVAPIPQRHARAVPTTDPDGDEPKPRPRPRATVTSTPTAAPTATSTNPVNDGDRGTLGKVVAWTSLGSFSVAAITGTIALSMTKSLTDSSSGSPPCDKDRNFCSSDGVSKINTAHSLALATDGLIILGIASAITWYFLPTTKTAPTVGASPVPGGAVVGVGGKF